ncbi:MAG: YbhB/YbcL family Raf kinase inhibitor-like protein [Planctomycetota bacterium]
MSMKLTSTAFDNGQTIPGRYTGDGEDLSPPLSFSGVPEQAKELALIADDPDAPPHTWVHWVIYKIPPTVDGLDEGVEATPQPSSPAGALQGKNDFGNIGYGGPMPPKGHGPHHYHFKLYALDSELDLDAGATKQELLDTMEGHIVAEGELVGLYQR